MFKLQRESISTLATGSMSAANVIFQDMHLA